MKVLLLTVVLFLGSAPVLFSAGGPAECVITIKSVQLQKDSGEWVTVIEPDHQVDLANQEPTVSFFNNGRRVPEGHYGNFKIFFSYKGSAKEIQIYGSNNFKEALKVKGRSFISVWFKLNLMDALNGVLPEKVEQAAVVVDEQTIIIPGENIKMVFT